MRSVNHLKVIDTFGPRQRAVLVFFLQKDGEWEMTKNTAQKLLEDMGAGRPSVINADKLLKEYGLDEEMGTSINGFLMAQNKIPKIYRDREITLGSQILLWLWMRSRFDEFETKIMQEIQALNRTLNKIADREKTDNG